MSPNIIYNPVVPFVGHIGGYLAPMNFVRIQGTVHPGAHRFALNLQCGPNVHPRDDVAFHFSPDFNRSCIIRNNILGMNWGPEECHGHFPFMRGQPFDIMILCEHNGYKIAVNGQHYTVFEHRVPHNRVSHFSVDGDVTIRSIEYGGGLLGGSMPMTGGMPMGGPMPMTGGMPMGGPMPMTGGMPMGGPMPMTGGMPMGGPMPMTGGMRMGGPMPIPGAMPNPGYPVQGHGYPGGCRPGYPVGGHGGGMMGPMVAGGLAGAALTGHLSPKKMMKKQSKAHKKALKYGLPLAAAGVGAYAIHKMGHRSSSSSSSSSSSGSEEE